MEWRCRIALLQSSGGIAPSQHRKQVSIYQSSCTPSSARNALEISGLIVGLCSTYFVFYYSSSVCWIQNVFFVSVGLFFYHFYLVSVAYSRSTIEAALSSSKVSRRHSFAMTSPSTSDPPSLDDIELSNKQHGTRAMSFFLLSTWLRMLFLICSIRLLLLFVL